MKGLFLLSIPLMLNNIMRTLHDLVDTYFVSSFADLTGTDFTKLEDLTDASISAIQITFPITFVYISLGFGLSIAGTALLSQFRGAGLNNDARKYASQLILIAAIVGVFLNIFSYFVSPLLMTLYDANDYVISNASQYLQIRSFELPFLLIFFAFTAIRQSSGDTVTPVVLGIAAIIVNIILTPILVINQNMGVTGAAYATLIGNLVFTPAVIYLLFKAKTGITISVKKMVPNKFIIKKLVRTALPASIGQSLTAVGFYVLNIVIFSFGQDTVAAFSVGNRISSIFLHPVMAIGGVMAAYIGQNIGNLNPKRAKAAFVQGVILSVGIMTIGSIIGIIIRKPMADLFFDVGTDSFNLTVTYMLYLFIGLPLMSLYTSYIGAYNGAGKTMYTFWLGTIRLWFVRIPVIYVLKEFTNLGPSGVWYAMLASNLVIAFLGLYFMRFIDFKPKIEIEPALT